MKHKIAFAAGFTGTLLTGLIVGMPFINAAEGTLCEEDGSAIVSEDGIVSLVGNCSLSSDFTGNVVVPSGVTATLDLNGKTLSSSTGITLKNLGSLTINGEGSVVGSNNYTVLNQNNLTINGGSYSTTATIKTSSGPSLISNGWDLSSSVGATPKDKPAGSANYATLEINGGEFNGGLNNLKNDENGIMTIAGGSFSDPVGQKNAVLHSGKSLTITGGEFVSSKITLMPMGADKEKSLTIKGANIDSSIVFSSISLFDPTVSLDIDIEDSYILGATFSANSKINYHSFVLKNHSGGSLYYGGPSTELTNVNLSGLFSLTSSENVTLKNSTVGSLSVNSTGGVLTVEDSTVDCSTASSLTKFTASNGTINIKNSRVNCPTKTMTANQNTGTIEIEEGSEIDSEVATGLYGGTINIYGGTLEKDILSAYLYGSRYYGGVVNIYDGTFYGKLSRATLEEDQTIGPNNTNYTTDEDGTVHVGIINVYGGKFAINDDELKAAVKSGATGKPITEIAKGDETWYLVGELLETSEVGNESSSVEFETPIESEKPISLGIHELTAEDIASFEVQNDTLKAIYDITVYDNNGGPLAIRDNEMKISLKLAEDLLGYDNYTVAYLDDRGQIQEFFEASVSDDVLTFSTTHLSLYGIIATNNDPADDSGDEPSDDDSGKGSDSDSDSSSDASDDTNNVPNTSGSDSDSPSGPAVPNTGNDSEVLASLAGDSASLATSNQTATVLLYVLGSLSLTTAGTLALIKKTLA